MMHLHLFRFRTLMIAVAIVGFMLGGLAWIDRELRARSYHDKFEPHNSRLLIGQIALIYTQDGGPIGIGPGLRVAIPAGTKVRVAREAPSDDDLFPRRPVVVTILEGSQKGEMFSIERYHLRDTKHTSVPTPSEPPITY